LIARSSNRIICPSTACTAITGCPRSCRPGPVINSGARTALSAIRSSCPSRRSGIAVLTITTGPGGARTAAAVSCRPGSTRPARIIGISVGCGSRSAGGSGRPVIRTASAAASCGISCAPYRKGGIAAIATGIGGCSTGGAQCSHRIIIAAVLGKGNYLDAAGTAASAAAAMLIALAITSSSAAAGADERDGMVPGYLGGKGA